MKNIYRLFILLSLNSFCITNIKAQTQTIKDLNQKLEEIKQSNIKEQQACYKKFFINNCLNKVNDKMYKLTDEIETKIVDLKRQQRLDDYNISMQKRKQAQYKIQQEGIENFAKEQENIKDYEIKQQVNQDRLELNNIPIDNININNTDKVLNTTNSSKKGKQIRNNKESIKAPNINSSTDYQEKLKQMDKRKIDLEQRTKKINDYLNKNP